MTAFATVPDAFVKAKFDENFLFITGQARPIPKGGKNKGREDWCTDEDQFRENSPLHFFIFVNAFHECKKRGLLNAFEEKAGQEVLDLL